jgi:hypothetical protein
LTGHESFLARYAWTIDPVPSLRDLSLRLAEEIERYEGLSGWEAQESRINLYLFSCAIACTIDDHLAARPSRWFPKSELTRWRRDWTGCVDAACELLRTEIGSCFFDLARGLLVSAAGVLPESALSRCMRVPEAFRCQDLTHYDVYSMMDMCLTAFEHPTRRMAIVGSRTAGAYFAPLAAAYLRGLGYSDIGWATVRPKIGFTGAERHWVRQQIRRGALLLIVDDHQNTGHTQGTMLAALRGLGAQSRDMVVAVPGHPVNPHWTLPEEVQRGVRIFVLPPESRYKVKLLKDEGRPEYADGFQVRVKHLEDGVIAKSTGWGWLGYHAWIANSALEGFVPRAVGFSEGILYSEWIDGEPPRNPDPARIGEYVAKRVESLRLPHDPYFASTGYRWCGWNELIVLLRRVYGPIFGRLYTPAIRAHLRRHYVAPKPTLLDGRMAPREWIFDGTTLYKTDYEQHNFGGGELDLVDPAWDLAGAIFEFDLSGEDERQLIHTYLRHTSDNNLPDRLLLYKLLYSAVVMRGALYWMNRKPAESNQRYIQARDFATFQMARHCGRTIEAPAQWTPRLFFLDLDGVLDWPHLGFPHTTPDGIRALQHLAAGGYAVVLNTLRSVRHVREYCRAYHLPGGVAEMGSVFWDAVRGVELPLVDAPALDQLSRVRDELRKMSGVLLDDSYTYSIYAYKYQDGQPHGLSAVEVEQALSNAAADRCGYVLKGSGTHIIQKDRSKAASLPQVRSYLKCSNEPVVAIDDADPGLLAAADIAYTPANGAPELPAKCKRMRGRRQNGFLQAAVHLTGKPAARAPGSESLIDELLGVPDRLPYR